MNNASNKQADAIPSQQETQPIQSPVVPPKESVSPSDPKASSNPIPGPIDPSTQPKAPENNEPKVDEVIEKPTPKPETPVNNDPKVEETTEKPHTGVETPEPQTEKNTGSGSQTVIGDKSNPSATDYSQNDMTSAITESMAPNKYSEHNANNAMDAHMGITSTTIESTTVKITVV